MRLVRFLPILFLLALCLARGVAASNWDKDDHEIFELQHALEKSEGKGATFYSLLDIPRSATQAQIKRAYRKKSLEMHPDKNAGKPNAQKRFERLGLINKILRDGRKDRYDHFLKNGFPVWRGTGYFYARFRPGLGSVVLGLVLFSMGVEVAIRTLTVRQEREKLLRLKRSAMVVAWGPRFEESLLPAADGSSSRPTTAAKLVEKKVRVPLAGFADLPPLPSSSTEWDEQERRWKKCILAASQPGAFGCGARTVNVLVNRDEVLVNHDGEWWPLDEDEVRPPRFGETWPFRLIKRVVGGGGRGGKEAEAKDEDVNVDGKKEAEEIEEEARKVIASSSSSSAVGVDGNGESAGARKRKGKK